MFVSSSCPIVRAHRLDRHACLLGSSGARYGNQPASPHSCVHKDLAAPSCHVSIAPGQSCRPWSEIAGDRPTLGARAALLSMNWPTPALIWPVSSAHSINVHAHRENVPAGGAFGYKLGSRSTEFAWGSARVGSTDFGSTGTAGLMLCGWAALARLKRGGLGATFFSVSETFVSNGML